MPSPLHDDDEFYLDWRQLESDLLKRSRGKLKPDSRRHLSEGALRRAYLVEASLDVLSRITDPERRGHRRVDESVTATLHLNSFYLHVRGMLDNLAWTLQYELDIIPGVTESTGQRRKIDLLSADFVKRLSQKHARAMALGEYKSWASELRDLRDPAAHRIPLYMPGGHTDESGEPRPFEPLLIVSRKEVRNLVAQVWSDSKSLLAVSKLVLHLL